MKVITFNIILMLSVTGTFGQNLIGFNNREIKEYMKEHHKDMNFNKVTNNKFKYLKYSDNFDSQTLLFFLNADSVCQTVRLICDQRVKGDKIKEFNSIYNKSGENRWIDTREGKNYLIEIRDEQWSSVITFYADK